MRFLRWILPIAFGLSLAGCILTSGQIAVSFVLPDPLSVTSPTAVLAVPIDLNSISEYNDHKDDVHGVADLALLGEITNNGTAAIDVEFWMTGAPSSHTTADQVRGDPSAVRLWGPLHLAGSQTLRIDWDSSAALFTGRQALLSELQGDGAFTLYAIGPPGVTVYNFTLRQGVLLIVLDAGV
jgi:hypothetical protein